MNKLLLSATIPLIIGPLTFVVMQGLKALSATVDALPGVAKRFAVAGMSTLDKDAVKSVLAAGIAYLLHLAKKKA